MAMRSPKYNSQGFTLLEMLTIVGIVGVLAGIAVPSLVSLNKPLRDGTNQFKSHLSLIRTKAIASNKAYRIKPKFSTLAEYSDGTARNFIVEYAANCRVTTNGGTNGWQAASQFDLDLPPQIGLDTTSTATVAVPGTPSPGVTINQTLTWNICFDNRGIIGLTPPATAPPSIILKDFQGNSRAKLAAFVTSAVGGTDVYLYNSATDTAPLAEGGF